MLRVLLACALLAISTRAGAQTEIRFPGAGDLGVFDPAPASGPTRSHLWMSYSGVSDLAVGSAHIAAVSTRLASSADRGATWDDTGVVLNPARVEGDPPPEFAGMPALWQHEVSRMVYDRRAATSERWKLVWHRYLHVDDGNAATDDRRFEYSWIGLKAASSPEELASAPERKLFAGLGYYLRPDVTSYNDSVSGAPEVRLDRLDPDLGDCVAFSEPGLRATSLALYVSLSCASTQPEGSRIVLLKWPMPAGPWEYRGTLLRAGDAVAADPDFTSFTASELVAQGRRTYLIASPTVQPFDWYGGCLVFALEDLDRATLRDADGDGRPDVLLRLVGSPGSFNGACGWDRAAHRSGVLYGEVFAAPSSTFRMFESGVVPPRPR
jgi:hypothetical protein